MEKAKRGRGLGKTLERRQRRKRKVRNRKKQHSLQCLGLLEAALEKRVWDRAAFGPCLWVASVSEEAQVPWGGAAARCAHELCVSWAAQARGILMVSVPEQLPAIHRQLLIAGLKIPHGKML